MGHYGGDAPLVLDGVAGLSAPRAPSAPSCGDSDVIEVQADASPYPARSVSALDSAYLARSVSAVDSGYRDGDDDEDDDNSDSTCSVVSGSGSSSSGVKDLVSSALHSSDQPASYGDISVRHSENVHIGNNTHFHGKVTVLLSSSSSVNGVAVPAVLPGPAPDLVLAAAKPLEAERGAGDGRGGQGFPIDQRTPLTRPGFLGIKNLLTETSADDDRSAVKLWRRPYCFLPAALGALLLAGVALTFAVMAVTATKDAAATATPPEPITLPSGLTVVPRAEWVAMPPREGVVDLVTPVEYVIIHHSATDTCYSHPECVKQTRYIQQFHMESRNWSDIAYNFLVGGDGYAYVGRGWDRQGAHTFNWNVRSIGICLIGTFTYQRPTIEQMRAALKLIEWGVSQGKIVAEYKLAGVCQLRSSESPGKELFAEIKRWDHWWNYTVGDSNCK